LRKHAFSTRLWHWVNALSVIVLFMSGLNISNAHPHLYWGQWGFDPKDSWMRVAHFPGWATIPGYYSLASARDWHVLFAWVFGLALVLFLVIALLNGHLRRDIATKATDWRPSAVWHDVREHLRGHFDAVGAKYNFLQKAAYGVVLFILLPLMLLTGLAISPGMDAAWPFLLDVFAGRQSARSVHFIVAWALFAFLVLHVVLVLLNKPVRNLRDMITGGRIDEAT
jgi:thiosulfate reductase cytochrome b subunit